MTITIYNCSTDSTLKATIANGQNANLPPRVCNGQWIFEVTFEIQITDPNLIIGLTPQQVINDIFHQGFHVGHYGLTSSGLN